jgi:Methane oxygenase PmoA
MVKKILIAFLLLTGTIFSSAQKIASFEVELTSPTNGIEIPTSVSLDNISFVPDSLLTLVEVSGANRTPIPFQITQSKNRVIHWIILPRNDANKKRVYELVKGKPSNFDQMRAVMNDGSLTIQSGNKNLLRYWYKTVYPPAGVDSSFKRSGFIHPLWTPNGQELTRIQAPDHYHHYGIWNPWTHVFFEGDTVDFWNLRGKKGTVRFGKFAAVTSGPVFSEFKAIHEHVAFKKDKTEKVALNEVQTVRVYKPENNQDYYIADITIEMNCASESPFLIVEYRYAGLGWRATEKWKKDNSEVLSSEGKTRKDVDGTTARWCIVQGALDNDYGGAVMMSYPSNYNYPEPMRIWPENSNQGEMFAMFAPTKNTNWLLEPGKTYALNYRFVVFNGKFTKEKAESAWKYFATQPKLVIK